MAIPLLPRERIVCGVALAAAALFVGSLAAGALAYAFPFGQPAGAWSFRAAAPAIAADAALFSMFALHHSWFATARVKCWIARASPRLERTWYVFVASGLFILVCWAWQPVPGEPWRVGQPWATVLPIAQVIGVGITVQASRALDVFDLAGLRQACARPPSRAPMVLRTGLYGVVRHPIYFGWMLMVWPTPHMTGSRLAFAAASTIYLLVAIPREERVLGAAFGDDYARYRRAVRWRIVPFVY